MKQVSEFYNEQELKDTVKKGIHMLIDNYNKGIIYTPLDHIAYGILKRQAEKYKKLRKMNHERIKKKNKHMVVY